VALAAGCAKSSDVERIAAENRVRDARVKALEASMAEALRKETSQVTEKLEASTAALRNQASQAAEKQEALRRSVEALQRGVEAGQRGVEALQRGVEALQRGVEAGQRSVEALQRNVEARAAATAERLEQLATEQRPMEAEGEATRAALKKLERRHEEYVKAQAAAWQEQANDLDKLRLRMQDVDRMLRSPIGDLPSATEADKAWREAHYQLISGQLDTAADRFAQFMQSYPADRRRPEALLRQGQAYFMLRKYDFALAPLYELADKYGTSKAALEGRWYIARALEETGDLKLARDFYAQLVNGKSPYAADAARRMALIQKLTSEPGAAPRGAAREPAKPEREPGRPERDPGKPEREPGRPQEARTPDPKAPERPAGGEKG
jgi:TolA-binding protein